MTRRMYDAAYPPPDPHLDVCAFYIGGNTPHVWSDSEIAAQSARWRLPIYVCSNPDTRNPDTDAAEAIAWLRAHGVPAGSALALDYETAIDAGYLTAFNRNVFAAGWTVLAYGSLSTIVQNPRPSAGYWTASWNGIAHLDSVAQATQWASDTMLGKPYDLSEVADTLVLWDTQAPPPQEADMTPDQANQLEQLTNAVFFGGTDMGTTPPGAANNSLVAKSDFLLAAVQKLQAPDPAAFVAALVADPDAITKFAAAVAAALPAPPTVDQIAAAVAAHFSGDLKQG